MKARHDVIADIPKQSEDIDDEEGKFILCVILFLYVIFLISDIYFHEELVK